MLGRGGRALGQRGLALGIGCSFFQFAELVDGVAHGVEARLAVAKAQCTGSLRILFDLLYYTLGHRRPLLETAVELLDQGQRVAAGLHGSILLHPIVGLLEVFRVAGFERLGVCAGIAVQQTALGDESLIEIAVGIEQQADHW